MSEYNLSLSPSVSNIIPTMKLIAPPRIRRTRTYLGHKFKKDKFFQFYLQSHLLVSLSTLSLLSALLKISLATLLS